LLPCYYAQQIMVLLLLGMRIASYRQHLPVCRGDRSPFEVLLHFMLLLLLLLLLPGLTMMGSTACSCRHT
jgi:hypothetical protein